MERGGHHKVWIAQCEASVVIRARYGLSSAFDHLVLEKLANFADAATTRPEFARELAAFVAAVRRLFTPEDFAANWRDMTKRRPQWNSSGALRTLIPMMTMHWRNLR
jgi:hypothetical protein